MNFFSKAFCRRGYTLVIYAVGKVHGAGPKRRAEKRKPKNPAAARRASPSAQKKTPETMSAPDLTTTLVACQSPDPAVRTAAEAALAAAERTNLAEFFLALANE